MPGSFEPKAGIEVIAIRRKDGRTGHSDPLLATTPPVFPSFRLPVSVSAHLPFWHPLRPVIPILGGTHIRHSPLVPVPAVEPIHLEGPEAGGLVADHDQAIGVAHVDAEGAIGSG